MFDYRPKMFNEASRSHASKNIIVIILCFIVFMIVAVLLESIIPSAISAKPMLEEMENQGYLESSEQFGLAESMEIATKVSSSPKIMLASLYSTMFGTLAAIFYCRCVEMRPVRSMGARKKRFFTHYLTGIIVGLVLMSAIALLSAAFGITRLNLRSDIDFGLIFLFLLGFIVQGMSEEFIFRGYFMVTIGGSGKKTYIAVAISAVGFALAHASNPGFGVLPFINLTLYGVFAALYLIFFDNIWGISAIHSIWNFAQGNIYGISVSGSGDTESVLISTPLSSHDFLTGGKFGIEGSLITTLVLCIGTALLLYAFSKKKPIAEEIAAENV